MKLPDIKRGIISPHRRQEGDAPDLGRVGRVRDGDSAAGDARTQSRRARGAAARKRSILVWSVWLGLGTMALIVLAISLWLVPYLFPEIDIKNIAPPPEVKVRVESKFPSPTRDEAVDKATRAVTERDPEKIATRFRMGATTPAEVVDFLKTEEARDGPVDHYDWLSSMDSDGLLMEGVLVVYKGKEKPVERLAFLTPDEKGDWKVDFAAYARTVSPSWNELLEKGADHGIVRIFLGRDVYYNGPFSDENLWTCYGMASPDMDVLLRGYCKVGSPQAEALVRLFSDERRVSRATLELQRVKDGGERQFEITKLLAQDWVLPDPPADSQH